MAKQKPNMALIPEFAAGEMLTVQRNVNGQNVLMFVEVREPCTLTADRMVLTAGMKQWGVSAYADARVARQGESINRLLEELQLALELLGNASWLEAPGEVEDQAKAFLAKYPHGLAAVPDVSVYSDPQQLTNPDGSGYQN